MRFLEKRVDKIVSGILWGGIIHFIGYILMYLMTIANSASNISYYIAIAVFYLGEFVKF